MNDRVVQLDEALFRRLAAAESPMLDRVMVPLTRAADHSLLAHQPRGRPAVALL